MTERTHACPVCGAPCDCAGVIGRDVNATELDECLHCDWPDEDEQPPAA